MRFRCSYPILTYSFSLLFALSLTTSSSAAISRREQGLAGIRLGDIGLRVIRRYGTPSRVLVTNPPIFVTVTPVIMPPGQKDRLLIDVNNLLQQGQGVNQGYTGLPGTPPGPYGMAPYGGAPGMTPYGPNPYAPSPYGPASTPYTPGASPYAPGAPSPYGPYGTPGQPGAPGLGGEQPQQGPPLPQVTVWIYNYPEKNLSNVFVLDEEGRVVAIGQFGSRPSTITSRGIKLGDPYELILRRYGFPESHKESIPGSLEVDYSETRGVRFWFINRRLKGHQSWPGKGPWCVGILVERMD